MYLTVVVLGWWHGLRITGGGEWRCWLAGEKAMPPKDSSKCKPACHLSLVRGEFGKGELVWRCNQAEFPVLPHLPGEMKSLMDIFAKWSRRKLVDNFSLTLHSKLEADILDLSYVFIEAIKEYREVFLHCTTSNIYQKAPLYHIWLSNKSCVQ